MENNSTEREYVPYSEKVLSEKLDFTCEQLYPTTGFRLELQGIVPSVLARKELEAYSGVNLDSKSGATIELAYDVAEQQLLLESLHHPLDRQSAASLVIQRTSDKTEGLEYIAFLDFSGREFSPAESKKDKPLISEDIDRILEGYGVTNIPHPAHNEYRLWRANLLSNCQQGWKVSEEVEMFVDMQEHKTETIRVGLNEQYQEAGIVSRTKQISRVFNVVDDSGTSGQQFEASLIQIDNKYGRALHLRNELVQIEYQPFIPGDIGTVSDSRIENLSLNYDNFNAFKSLLDDAVRYLDESKDI